MRRIWLLAAAAACIAGSVVCAYLARPAAAPPGLDALRPTCDLGEIGQGETIAVEFELVNHFPRPVQIKDVLATCACTNVDWPKEPLGAGEKGVVKAQWRTGGTRGTRITDIAVLYDREGGGEGRTPLRIQGMVAPDLLYSPEWLDFERGTAATRKVIFRAGRLANGAAKTARCSHRAFTATLAEGSQEVVVTFDPSKWTVDDDNLAPGSVGQVLVETTSPNEPVSQIPLIVRGRGSSD
jgi:hypothetical protein